MMTVRFRAEGILPLIKSESRQYFMPETDVYLAI